MNPQRKAAAFLLAVAVIILIVGAAIAGTQNARADTCRFDNSVHDLAGRLEVDSGLHNSEPGPTVCGVRPPAWILLGAGGILAVIGATMLIAGGTPTTSSGLTRAVEKERQFRRIG